MPEPTTQPAAGPYAQAFESYINAGWRGVLHLPPRKKKSPPDGYTGNHGVWPSVPDMYAWAEGPQGAGNICLRLPADVLGIDVDDYGKKQGGATLDQLIEQLGDLPKTWRSGSRDGRSGIALYRIPEGLAWPSVAGPDIEIIRYGHRYAVVWPSIHPDTGGTYRWTNPDGQVSLSIPRANDLPDLPESWLMHLTGGAAADDTPRANLTTEQTQAWLKSTPDGPPCPRVEEATADIVAKLRTGASRHDTQLVGVNRLLWLGGAGHPGVSEAIETVRQAFREAATDRNEHELAGEWSRSLDGGVARAAGKYPRHYTTDPCRHGTNSAAAAAQPPTGMEEMFWASRPELAHIKTFALARMASPWAVLGMTLARVALEVPPYVKLPPIIGGPASLNLIVALVAGSGGGKGAAEGAADAAFTWPSVIDRLPITSGEGIVHAYMTRLPVEGKKGQYELVQGKSAVGWSCGEVDHLAALWQRQGNTLEAVLRAMYSGELIGSTTADPAKRVRLRAHSYRATLTIGVQPARAGILFDPRAVAGGTLQRMLWLPATSQEISADPPPEPDPLRLTFPPLWHGRVNDPDGSFLLPVPEVAWKHTREMHAAAQRGERPAADGHANLTRLKVAALLGILNGRAAIDDNDWILSAIVMAMSDMTRENIRATLSDAVVKSDVAAGRSEGRRREAAEDVIHEESVKRAVKSLSTRLKANLSTDGVSFSELRRGISTRLRDVADEALDALMATGQVEVTDTTYQGQEGKRVRWVG